MAKILLDLIAVADVFFRLERNATRSRGSRLVGRCWGTSTAGIRWVVATRLVQSRDSAMKKLLLGWKWLLGLFDQDERRRRKEKQKIKEMADFLERNRKVDS